MVDSLPHLLWPAADQRVLLLGHFDPVFPVGIANARPLTVIGDVATGPGVSTSMPRTLLGLGRVAFEKGSGQCCSHGFAGLVGGRVEVSAG